MRREVKNPHPGDILKHEFLDELKVSAYKLSKEIDISEALISQIINGKKPISVDLAIRLGRFFNTSPDLWINLQRSYDIMELERMNKSEYKKIKPLVMA
jgi:addiction module HigA family antidote